MSEFFITYADNTTILPKKESISAVFLIAIKGSKILAIENEKGWDIPGGHIEPGETPEIALAREVQEEAGAVFNNAQLLAIIKSDNQDKYKDMVMLVYTTNNFTLGDFTPSEDALNREVLEIPEFIQRYKGGKHLNELILNAQKLFT